MMILRVSKLETLVIAMSLSVSGLAGWLYLVDYGFRNRMFDLGENKVKKIGSAEIQSGSARRQGVAEIQFSALTKKGQVFDQDTIVSGSDSKVTVTLDDGSQIQLGADTMVRIESLLDISLGGVSRSPKINVVTGNIAVKPTKTKIFIEAAGKVTQVKNDDPPMKIEAQALPIEKKLIIIPPPEIILAPETVAVLPSTVPVEEKAIEIASPTPAPILTSQVKYTLLSPKPDDVLSITSKNEVPDYSVHFLWNTTPDSHLGKFELYKIEKNSEKTSLLKTEVKSSSSGQGEIKYQLKSPGNYEWFVKSLEGTMSESRRFSVKSDFKAIKTKKHLINGKVVLNNSYNPESNSTKINFQLNWTPVFLSKNYQLEIVPIDNEKYPKKLETVSEPTYELKSLELLEKGFSYRVIAPLENGFRAVSDFVPVSFVFKAPLLKAPKPETILNQSMLAFNENKVTLIWTKTGFTNKYLAQLSKSPSFDSIISEKETEDNIWVTTAENPGDYYWRVKSMGEGLNSSFSAPNHFSVK